MKARTSSYPAIPDSKKPITINFLIRGTSPTGVILCSEETSWTVSPSWTPNCCARFEPRIIPSFRPSSLALGCERRAKISSEIVCCSSVVGGLGDYRSCRRKRPKLVTWVSLEGSIPRNKAPFGRLVPVSRACLKIYGAVALTSGCSSI